MEKKTYRLTADIGDLKRGATVKLTPEKATSPLYASRIVSADAGSTAAAVDLEAARAEADQMIADAQAEAKKIIEAAQAEAMKLAAGNGKK